MFQPLHTHLPLRQLCCCTWVPFLLLFHTSCYSLDEANFLVRISATGIAETFGKMSSRFACGYL